MLDLSQRLQNPRERERERERGRKAAVERESVSIAGRKAIGRGIVLRTWLQESKGFRSTRKCNDGEVMLTLGSSATVSAVAIGVVVLEF